MKSPKTFLQVICACLLSFFLIAPAQAIKLGELKLYSDMQEPLRAEIDLLDVDVADISSVTVDLANRQAFAQAGMERKHFITNLNFQILKQNNALVVRITTDVPVKETYLAFLLEAKSAKDGSQDVREYTALFDLEYLSNQGESSAGAAEGGAKPQPLTANQEVLIDPNSVDLDNLPESGTANARNAALETAQNLSQSANLDGELPSMTGEPLASTSAKSASSTSSANKSLRQRFLTFSEPLRTGSLSWLFWIAVVVAFFVLFYVLWLLISALLSRFNTAPKKRIDPQFENNYEFDRVGQVRTVKAQDKFQDSTDDSRSDFVQNTDPSSKRSNVLFEVNDDVDSFSTAAEHDVDASSINEPSFHSPSNQGDSKLSLENPFNSFDGVDETDIEDDSTFEMNEGIINVTSLLNGEYELDKKEADSPAFFEEQVDLHTQAEDVDENQDFEQEQTIATFEERDLELDSSHNQEQGGIVLDDELSSHDEADTDDSAMSLSIEDSLSTSSTHLAEDTSIDDSDVKTVNEVDLRVNDATTQSDSDESLIDESLPDDYDSQSLSVEDLALEVDHGSSSLSEPSDTASSDTFESDQSDSIKAEAEVEIEDYEDQDMDELLNALEFDDAPPSYSRPPAAAEETPEQQESISDLDKARTSGTSSDAVEMSSDKLAPSLELNTSTTQLSMDSSEKDEPVEFVTSTASDQFKADEGLNSDKHSIDIDLENSFASASADKKVPDLTSDGEQALNYNDKELFADEERYAKKTEPSADKLEISDNKLGLRASKTSASDKAPAAKQEQPATATRKNIRKMEFNSNDLDFDGFEAERMLASYNSRAVKQMPESIAAPSMAKAAGLDFDVEMGDFPKDVLAKKKTFSSKQKVEMERWNFDESEVTEDDNAPLESFKQEDALVDGGSNADKEFAKNLSANYKNLEKLEKSASHFETSQAELESSFASEGESEQQQKQEQRTGLKENDTSNVQQAKSSAPPQSLEIGSDLDVESSSLELESADLQINDSQSVELSIEDQASSNAPHELKDTAMQVVDSEDTSSSAEVTNIELDIIEEISLDVEKEVQPLVAQEAEQTESKSSDSETLDLVPNASPQETELESNSSKLLEDSTQSNIDEGLEQGDSEKFHLRRADDREHKHTLADVDQNEMEEAFPNKVIDDETNDTATGDLSLELDLASSRNAQAENKEADVDLTDLDLTVGDIEQGRSASSESIRLDPADEEALKEEFEPVDSSIEGQDQSNLKIDLARMYINLGDIESAKEMLEEALEEGSEEQKNIAQKLLLQL